jgi:hypothetical protein
MKFVLSTIWKMPLSEFRFFCVVLSFLCKVLVGGLATIEFRMHVSRENKIRP